MGPGLLESPEPMVLTGVAQISEHTVGLILIAHRELYIVKPFITPEQ